MPASFASKVSIASQLVNVILDPLFIFGFGPIQALGIAGAALATCVAEIVSFFTYAVLMLRRRLVRLRTICHAPSWASLKPLLVGGAAVQLRAVALNTAFLAVVRSTLEMDATGTLAAAHTITMQFWQLGGILLLSGSSIASVFVAQRMNRPNNGGPRATKAVADRLLMWGLIVGVFLGFAQLAMLPLLQVRGVNCHSDPHSPSRDANALDLQK